MKNKENNSATSEVPRSKNNKKKRNSNIVWSLTILLVSFLLSVLFNLVSETALKNLSGVPAFLILAAFVLIGIAFDIFGIAAATASEKPFNAMAAKRVSGAREALWIVKNAEKVSSICNDVIGDICGIMSGSTAAIIVASFLLTGTESLFVSLGVTGMVAGLTVGGKAFGKGFGIKYSNSIVFFMARFLRIFKRKKS